MTWQPIETAPKDGTVILLSDGKIAWPGGWNPSVHGHPYPWVFMEDLKDHQPHGCCDNEEDSRINVNAWRDDGPTHWMPLPPPPS